MPKSRKALRAQVAAVAELVRELRDELAKAHGGHAVCTHLHYEYPAPAAQPQVTHVIPRAQPYTAPQTICATLDGVTTVNLPYSQTAGAAPVAAACTVNFAAN